MESDILVGYVRLRILRKLLIDQRSREAGGADTRTPHLRTNSACWWSARGEGYQHKGYGTQLLQEAERIATEEYDCRKMLVISALGTKQYYAKFVMPTTDHTFPST